MNPYEESPARGRGRAVRREADLAARAHDLRRVRARTSWWRRSCSSRPSAVFGDSTEHACRRGRRGRGDAERRPTSPAADAGMRAGRRHRRGRRRRRPHPGRRCASSSRRRSSDHPGEPIAVVVDRDGQRHPARIVPELDDGRGRDRWARVGIVARPEPDRRSCPRSSAGSKEVGFADRRSRSRRSAGSSGPRASARIVTLLFTTTRRATSSDADERRGHQPAGRRDVVDGATGRRSSTSSRS